MFVGCAFDDFTSSEFITIEVLTELPGIYVEGTSVNQEGKINAFVSIDCDVAPGVYRIEMRATDEDGLASLATLLLCVELEKIEPVVNDTAPGAVLVFSFYTSDGASPAKQNTRMCLTNTHVTRRATIHLFMVDGESCSVADSYLTLTPNQTTCFMASDIDPGVTGYAIAVVVDGATGFPVKENVLIGDAFIKMNTGVESNLRAESLQALWHIAPPLNPEKDMAELRFDGFSYSPLPRVLAISSIPSYENDNNTLLVLNRISGNLAASLDPVGPVAGILFDDIEAGTGFCLEAETCQFRQWLADNSLMRATKFKKMIPSGRSGWLKVWATNDVGMLGAAINFHASPKAVADAFRHGSNLHRLTYSHGSRLQMPVFPAHV